MGNNKLEDTDLYLALLANAFLRTVIGHEIKDTSANYHFRTLFNFTKYKNE